jgi:hypothetical protein
MGVHVAAPPPMHTWVRLRAPQMRPLPSRARVGTSAGIYSQRTRHILIYIYMYIYRCEVRVCKWVMGTHVCCCIRVRSRAGADDARIRGVCASAMRSLRKAIHRWNTHRYRMEIHDACINLHARLATPMKGSAMRARRTHAPASCVHARACACGVGRPRIRADTCERLPPASTVGGSARRRSTWRRRSTRTSARGTLPQCRTWSKYAPPFRPRRRVTAAGRARPGRRCGAGRCARRRRRCARARVCAQTCGHAHGRASGCVGIAARRNDGIYVCMDIYLYTCMYALYINISIG